MSTAVANPPNGAVTIRDRLKNPALIAELGKAMPKHCSPERMARVALTAITRTPKLAQCTEASFFECLLSLSQWGLEPDGRRAHLIPYGNKATLIIDYKGYVELAYRSGVVKNLHADVVRDGDLFEYNLGRVVKHVPHFLRRDADKPLKAGEVFAAYCTATLDGGIEKSEVMSKEDVEGIRRRSKAGGSGPWVTDWNEMAKKTAFRRLSKWLPLSAEILDAFDRDHDAPESLVNQNGNETSRAPVTLDSIAQQIEQEEVVDDQGEVIETTATPVKSQADENRELDMLDQLEQDLDGYTDAAEVKARCAAAVKEGLSATHVGVREKAKLDSLAGKGKNKGQRELV